MAEAHVGQIGVLVGRQIGHDGAADMADLTENAAMAAGRDIAARPRVGFRHVARGEELLILDQKRAEPVAPLARPPRRANRYSAASRGYSAVRRR